MFQIELVRSMKGMEKRGIYASTGLRHWITITLILQDLKYSLETKTHALVFCFFAGQINGTTVNEEAGAQRFICGFKCGITAQR